MLGKALAKAARPPYIPGLGRQRRIEGRDVAQPGSASHWGCGGRRFESSRPDQFINSFVDLSPLNGNSITQRPISAKQDRQIRRARAGFRAGQ